MKNIILTGCTSGIGLELLKMLCDHHHVGLVIRNKQKKDQFLHSNPEFASHNFKYYLADLTETDQAVAVASQILKDWDHVDILFNNAGVMATSPSQYKSQIKINSVSPYYLTLNLMPALLRASEPIIINSVTDALHLKKFDSINDLIDTNRLDTISAYMNSKLLLAILMNYLAEQWSSDNNLRVVNVSPGGNKTPMVQNPDLPWVLRLMARLLYKHPKVGATKLYQAAFNNYSTPPKFKNQFSPAELNALLKRIETSSMLL